MTVMLTFRHLSGDLVRQNPEEKRPKQVEMPALLGDLLVQTPKGPSL